MKKVTLTISLAMASSIGAMELSQEFKQYLFDHQLPADHPWENKRQSDEEVRIRDQWGSAELVVAKRIAIEKVIKAHNLTHVQLVPGYVRFGSKEIIKSASDITANTKYEVLQEEPVIESLISICDRPINEQEAEEVTTLLKCVNESTDNIRVNKDGVYMMPGSQTMHFVESWPHFWFSEFKFDDKATAAMEKKQEYLQAYVLKCLKNYRSKSSEEILNSGGGFTRLPLLPEPDEVAIEGTPRIKLEGFNTVYKYLFKTDAQEESFWQDYDEHSKTMDVRDNNNLWEENPEAQRWLNKDFFKGPFNQE